MLPVQLPKIDQLNSIGNPLGEMSEWKNITIDGKKYVRETDTLDTFVDSSWYFLRFCSPHNKDYGFNIDEIKYWMPVDQYIGGVEHAILHLLYSRFYANYRMKIIHLTLRSLLMAYSHKSMVCHETYKDKNNNWVSPDELISIDGKKFLKGSEEPIKIGPSESMSKSKKILSILKKL